MKKKTQDSLRMFENPLLESLSKTSLPVPFLFWSPVVLYFLSLSFTHSKASTVFIGFFAGGFLWTLLEYLLHRFLFHLKSENKWAQALVFTFHGVHHDAPQDKGRLLFPPAPAALIALMVYWFLKILVPNPLHYSLFSGLLVAYLFYDYIHYATHHFPMKSKVGRFLKHYHLKHHYVCPDKNFGVSSPLWDIIFKTKQEKKSSKDTCLDKASHLA